MQRTILHADLDAFYASVEIRDDPSLAGKPVVVGGDARRGVVLAASYAVRKFGIRSAMSMFEAHQRCKDLVVVRPRMGRYAELSHEFFEILARWSPLVEALSLDEAFLDVTGEERLLGDGPTIARRIKDEVKNELSLIVSVGVAPSKFVAKIASDLGKPDGLVVVPTGTEREFLAPLPVGRLWGVGKVTEEELVRLGLRTIGDLARAGEAVLSVRLGAHAAQRLGALARGEDDRHVEPDRAPVSVGSEDTFERDHRERGPLEIALLAQADRGCARLRALGLRARIVTLKIKYSNHQSITRRATLDRPSSDSRAVSAVARKLLAEVPAIEVRGVRLTGISLSGLEDRDGARQLLLDESTRERGEHLGETLDAIAKKFGGRAVRRAVHLDEDASREDTIPRRK